MSGPATHMRALRLHRVRAARQSELLAVDEVRVPEPAPTEALVEVAACGLGAMDLAVTTGSTPHGPRLPQILGHEAAGTIAAVGDEVTDWHPGDRVAVPMVRSCKRCGYCAIGRENLCRQRSVPGVDRDGALAGYLLADPDLLAPIPGGVPFHEAALVTDAVASPYHALKRAGLAERSTVAIVGLGGLGMHAVVLAKLWGADVLGIDPDPVNRERASAWGADAVVDGAGDPVATVRGLTGGGVDRALDFAGTSAAVRTTVGCVAAGGRAVLAGLSPETWKGMAGTELVTDEIEVAGSFGSTLQDVGELFDLLEDERLDLSRSVTHTTDLRGAGDALLRLESREGHPIRTVVTDLT